MLNRLVLPDLTPENDALVGIGDCLFQRPPPEARSPKKYCIVPVMVSVRASGADLYLTMTTFPLVRASSIWAPARLEVLDDAKLSWPGLFFTKSTTSFTVVTGFVPDVSRAGAVSYTHLDVYKRQLMFRPNSNSGNETSATLFFDISCNISA